MSDLLRLSNILAALVLTAALIATFTEYALLAVGIVSFVFLVGVIDAIVNDNWGFPE